MNKPDGTDSDSAKKQVNSKDVSTLSKLNKSSREPSLENDKKGDSSDKISDSILSKLNDDS